MVQRHRKLQVRPLVPTDELVAEAQPRHDASLLQPEDGTERAREEDALDAHEGDQPLSERRRRVHPGLGPVRLALNDRYSLDGPEQALLFSLVLDQLVNHQRVGLAVDSLVEPLVRVERASL